MKRLNNSTFEVPFGRTFGHVAMFSILSDLRRRMSKKQTFTSSLNLVLRFSPGKQYQLTLQKQPIAF